jgi:hypothetical protein
MSQPGVKMPDLDSEERCEVTIAARSERPADLSHVMRTVVIPELVNVLIPAPSDQERE